jgi:hypothetical protein
MWGYFSRAIKYEKHPLINAALDGVFTVLFFVVITDAFWVVLSLFRWLPLYPGDLNLLLFSLGRDLAAALLFFLMIGDHFRSGKLNLWGSLSFVGISFITQSAWYVFSPSPAFTDYTYAWRHGSDIWIIVGSWILSHWIMRIPLWLGILNSRWEMWR